MLMNFLGLRAIVQKLFHSKLIIKKNPPQRSKIDKTAFISFVIELLVLEDLRAANSYPEFGVVESRSRPSRTAAVSAHTNIVAPAAWRDSQQIGVLL